MSSEISEMYTATSIQDLPDEMLEQILLFLNFDDRCSALQVCKRWSTLKLCSSVKLVVNFEQSCDQEDNYHRTLLASTRQYKHLVLYFGENSRNYELLVEIVQHFSHKVEWLKLILRCARKRIAVITAIEQIIAFCFNLRYLHIGVCDYLYSQDLQPMHKLEELYVDNQFDSIPIMVDSTPNITRLHIEINSEEAETFLRHFSSQLVELEIRFSSKYYFLAVCEMQFPLLEKLNFRYNYISEIKEIEMTDLLFHQLPLLKEVTLRCNLDDRVIPNLCRSCVNIQFLCVIDSFLSQDSLQTICELKHLKRLILNNATVDVPPDMYSPQTSLKKLTLVCTYIDLTAKFNIFVQRAFPNLAVLELMDLTLINDSGCRWLIELHGQIFSNIPSLQRLVVSEPGGTTTLDQFLEFCASHAPKELRFKCWNILDILEYETPNRIPVQKLFLDSPKISPIVLKKLISSMEELRWLELALGDYCSPEVIRSLREQFPRCYVVAGKSGKIV